MDKEGERRRRLEFHAKLERLAAERVSSDAKQLNARRPSRDAYNANRIATISLAIVVIVTIATIVGVFLSIIGPHFGFSLGRATWGRPASRPIPPDSATLANPGRKPRGWLNSDPASLPARLTDEAAIQIL